MKKLLIMAPIKNEEKEKFLIYLQEYFGDKVEVVLGLFSDLTFEIGDGKILVELGGRSIDDFDLVYFRNTKGFSAMVNALAIYLESVKIKFFDRSFTNSFNGDKFSSLMRLALNKLPIVPTFLCSKEAIPQNKKKIVEKFGFPIVAKEVTTQRMQSIYLLNSLEDFDKLPELTTRGNPARYLFQKFIDFDKEFRLMVLGEGVGIIHTKTLRDNTKFQLGYSDINENPEFLNPSEVSNTIKNTAIKAAMTLHIQIAGVDICRERETGKIFVFEVNRGPGIDYDTTVSPELKKIAEFFEKELSDA
jgi:glutathione synthase/RimK-type ligase-like ATP-grasp enzyme